MHENVTHETLVLKNVAIIIYSAIDTQNDMYDTQNGMHNKLNKSAKISNMPIQDAR